MNKSLSRFGNPTLKVLAAILVAFFVFSGISAVWAITLPIPDINTYYEQLSKSQSTKVFDRTGKIQLYDMSGTVRRTQVSLAQISKYVKDGTIAIEDDKFYSHNGIEPTSMLRALFVDITSGSKKEGASTITQQVVKNTLLSNEKTWTRKIKEVVLALKLEKSMSKDQILELYLNEIPYGGMIYGVQEAATTFFGKEAKDLTLAESAYLAAIPQAPTTYSPYGN
ncbi:MAG: transglycosylase domain-containing protein, partial [Candidatus Vogelbacteria bacterium]|nr:transglycosylase domain-containing protein [Candidatus Vogelbacteria bacterium]